MSATGVDPATRDALQRVDAFIAAHPEYTLQGAPPLPQGSTNRVLAARRGNHLVVLKVFCEDERKERECVALRHWRPTGLVPELLFDDDPRLIVTSFVRGGYLSRTLRHDTGALGLATCRQVGSALAQLTLVPLPLADRAAFEARFYAGLGRLEEYLGRILALGRGVHGRDPDFTGARWSRSLDFVAAEVPALLAQPRALYHQDAGNLHVERGAFCGFFDLEMCRVGGPALQLAASPVLDAVPATWEAFRRAWEETTGASLTPQELRCAAAAHHLLCWREITRYMSYDGTPGTGYAWASPADPGEYHERLAAADALLGVSGAGG
ncbi:MAG: hypothetical protein AB1505_03495 [Candidatus Latescibacterota bacterium]